MSIDVDRYGVHWAPGKIAFLQQGRGGANAVGLPSPSPFYVKTSRRWVCNHLIGLAGLNPAGTHFARFEALLAKDSLARFMLPLPKDADRDTRMGVGRIDAEDFDADLMDVVMLSKMSSPVKIPIFRLSLTSTKTIMVELNMTDVQPLILSGVEAQHTAQVSELCAMATTAPRRLLVVAARDVPLPGVVELTAEHQLAQEQTDLIGLPWESFGACVLRAYMRQEWDGSWFTREPTPGNEKKVPYNATGRESAGVSGS